MNITTTEIIARRNAGEKHVDLLAAGTTITDLGITVIRNEIVHREGVKMQSNRRTLRLKYGCCGGTEDIRVCTVLRNIRQGLSDKHMKCRNCRKNAKKGVDGANIHSRRIGQRHLAEVQNAEFVQSMLAMMPARPYDRTRL